MKDVYDWHMLQCTSKNRKKEHFNADDLKKILYKKACVQQQQLHKHEGSEKSDNIIWTNSLWFCLKKISML